MSEDPVPYGADSRPGAFFLARLGQRVVVTVDNTIPRFPEIKPYGTHALGFLYADHEKGIALRIESFLVLSSDGFPFGDYGDPNWYTR